MAKKIDLAKEIQSIERDNKRAFDKQLGISSNGRDNKGRFAHGNTLSTDDKLSGAKSKDIRKHRADISSRVGELIKLLIEEAIVNKNFQVAMWLVGRIVPETRSATFSTVELVTNVSSMTELKEQSDRTIQDAVKGEVSLEETQMLMNAYKEHREAIKAAEIDPLIEEVSRRLGKA